MATTAIQATTLDLAHQEALKDQEMCRRRKEIADTDAERIDTYMKVLDLVRNGFLTAQTARPARPTGFFVRNYARVLGTRIKTYQFKGFHIPSFTTDPAAASDLPTHLQGTLEDCLTNRCRTPTCREEMAPVVGIVSYNKTGYHGNPSTVAFFTFCQRCRTVSMIDGGFPYEPPIDDED